jgi:hypothetical protein
MNGKIMENKPPATDKKPPVQKSINYKLAGKILLPIGAVMVLVWILDYCLNWGLITITMLYIGLLDIVASCCLIFFTSKKPPD